MRPLVEPLAARVYYGWVVLGTVSFTEVVSWGILYYAFSVFVAPTAAGALVFIALFGASSGTMTIVRAALLAERYGAANYGVISGTHNSLLTGARALAPLGAGLLAAALGGYPLLLLGLAGLCAAGCVAVLRVPG
jgi:MFS family permease